MRWLVLIYSCVAVALAVPIPGQGLEDQLQDARRRVQSINLQLVDDSGEGDRHHYHHHPARNHYQEQSRQADQDQDRQDQDRSDQDRAEDLNRREDQDREDEDTTQARDQQLRQNLQTLTNKLERLASMIEQHEMKIHQSDRHENHLPNQRLRLQELQVLKKNRHQQNQQYQNAAQKLQREPQYVKDDRFKNFNPYYFQALRQYLRAADREQEQDLDDDDDQER